MTSEPLLQPNDGPGQVSFQFSSRFWAMVVLTGIGTGLGAGLFMALLHLVQHTLYKYHTGDFQTAVEHASPIRRVAVLTAAGVIAAAGVLALKRSPGGKPGAINEAIWFKSTHIAVTKTILQGALSIIIVGMGASHGRESAPKEAGAAIASKLSEWTGLSRAETRFLTACGAGAGLGAVYNVPLGGALFALEVMLGTLALPLIPPALVTAYIATVVSWLLLPTTPTYLIPHFALAATQIVWAIPFGPIAGLASVLFLRLIILASRLKPKRGIAMLAPVLIFALVGITAIKYPQILGNGRGVTQLVFNNRVAISLLLVLIVLRPLATAFCLGSGAPGGLFTPSTTFGAVLGGALGGLWTLAWPGATPGSFAVIGAAAVLAATMQAPIAAIILMLELTHHDVTILVPILIAVGGASLTMRLFDRRSVYTGQIRITAQQNSRPFDREAAQRAGIIVSRPRSVAIWAGYRDVLETIVDEDGQQKPLYVIDETGRLIGRITPEAVKHVQPLTRMLVTGAPSDLMTVVTPLHGDEEVGLITQRLQADEEGELPVTDTNGTLIGIARRQAGDGR
jgi:H+/Cl- antiporter ClcA